MTQLSNIFVGDRVVQQMYLNDALMYQSNGWQQLPTTPQEQWKKEYLYDTTNINKSIYSVTDSSNNIYIMQGYTITKIDTEGNQLWRHSYAPLSYAAECMQLILDSDNTLWFIDTHAIYNVSSINGSLIKSVAIADSTNIAYSLVVLSDEIYLATYYNGDAIYLYKFDKNLSQIYEHNLLGIMSGQTSGYPHIFYRKSSNALYIILNNIIYKLDEANKQLLYTDTVYSSAGIISNYAIAEAYSIDKYDNMYIVSLYVDSPNNALLLTKFNAARDKLWTKVITTYTINIYHYNVNISSNSDDTVYITCLAYISPNTMVDIYKIETDGTYSWNKSIQVDNHNTCSFQPCVDSYNNIYIPTIYQDDIIVHKFLNLVKSE
jgi:hypothetical protein